MLYYIVRFIYCTIRNQWLCEQQYELSWRWARGPETCRESTSNIQIRQWHQLVFIPYVEKMHGTKSLKFYKFVVIYILYRVCKQTSLSTYVIQRDLVL